jgi:hypothetical protein
MRWLWKTSLKSLEGLCLLFGKAGDDFVFGSCVLGGFDEEMVHVLPCEGVYIGISQTRLRPGTASSRTCAQGGNVYATEIKVLMVS